MSAPIRRLFATPFRQLTSKMPPLECPRGRGMLSTRETGQATNSAKKDLCPSLPEPVCSGCHRPLPKLCYQCLRNPPKRSHPDDFKETFNAAVGGFLAGGVGTYVLIKLDSYGIVNVFYYGRDHHK